jgi:hypothetical protein
VVTGRLKLKSTFFLYQIVMVSQMWNHVTSWNLNCSNKKWNSNSKNRRIILNVTLTTMFFMALNFSWEIHMFRAQLHRLILESYVTQINDKFFPKIIMLLHLLNLKYWLN